MTKYQPPWIVITPLSRSCHVYTSLIVLLFSFFFIFLFFLFFAQTRANEKENWFKTIATFKRNTQYPRQNGERKREKEKELSPLFFPLFIFHTFDFSGRNTQARKTKFRMWVKKERGLISVWDRRSFVLQTDRTKFCIFEILIIRVIKIDSAVNWIVLIGEIKSVLSRWFC